MPKPGIFKRIGETDNLQTEAKNLTDAVNEVKAMAASNETIDEINSKIGTDSDSGSLTLFGWLRRTYYAMATATGLEAVKTAVEAVSTKLTGVDTKTNNLDATMTSRAPADTALSKAVWTDQKAGFLDAPISGISDSIDLTKINSTIGTEYEIPLNNRLSYTNLNNTQTWIDLRKIPYNAYKCVGEAVGDSIYIFGNTSGTHLAYKYSVPLGEYTKLANVPAAFNNGRSCSFGDDIYLFMGTNAYKYSTISNSYTKLSDIPYDFIAGSIGIVGDNIYLFGSSTAEYKRTAYKYSISTNTYLKIRDVPFDHFNAYSCAVGENIYMFGSGELSFRRYVYKYSTVSNSYVKLKDSPETNGVGMPINFYDDIYILGGSSSSSVYKYDPLSDSYTKLSDNPSGFNSGCLGVVGSSIYTFTSEKARKLNVFVENNIVPSYMFKNTKIYTDGVVYNSSREIISGKNSITIAPLNDMYYIKNSTYISIF